MIIHKIPKIIVTLSNINVVTFVTIVIFLEDSRKMLIIMLMDSPMTTSVKLLSNTSKNAMVEIIIVIVSSILMRM